MTYQNEPWMNRARYSDSQLPTFGANIINPSNAKAHFKSFGPKHKNTKIFEKHLNPMVLLLIG